MDKTKQRISTYIIVGFGLSFSYLAFYNSSWDGSSELHSIMEALATLLGLFVGALALTRYYSHGGIKFLIYGAGFIGVAFLDGYHGVVTSNWFKAYLASELESLSLWSWLASRIFLGCILLSAFIIIKTDLHKKAPRLLSSKSIYSSTLIATLSSFLIVVLIPLPSGYYDDFFFYHPAEIIPAILFSITLIGNYRLGLWQHDEFEHWLILAIIVNLVAQLVYMPFSSENFDANFDIAHLLKTISYIFVLIGLIISVYKSFRRIESEANVRHKAQRALEASEIRNRTMMNSLVDGLITISDTGIIENANQSACQLFRYSKLELLGRNIKMLMPNPYHDKHDGYLSTYKETGKPHIVGNNRNVVGLRKDGTTFPMNLAVSEMIINGKMKFSGIVRDDTERQKFEEELITARNQAEIAAEAKSNFLATMSHEIRTPMNGVIGMVELLQNTELDIQQQDIVRTIADSGHALVELINDILEISKIEAGKIELHIIDFNLERTAYDVTRLLSIKAEEKDIELIFNYHTDCPNYVYGDAGRLRQIMLNLVGNAIKFTHSGQVMINISCKNQTKSECVFRIEVIDTGIGIEDSVKDKLFDSFTQADETTNRKYGGTGLGLSICKNLVQLMNGTIDVISTPGNGSTFWFELKLNKSQAPDKPKKVELENLRALTVLNNALSQKMLGELLTNWKIEVSESSYSDDIVQLLINASSSGIPYDFVIIDNNMSDIYAENIGREIKSNKSLINTPLILLASSTTRGGANRYKDIGYSAYITKPILSDLLYETLTRVLGRKHENTNIFITRHSIHEEMADTDALTQLSGHILLAEDVLVNQKVVTGMLNKFELKIDIANNGQEAIEKYNDSIKNNTPYNLILMDCQMPVMDGFEATRKIRESDQDIKIIAVTANALSSDRNDCIDAGMSDYLPKPFDQKKLINILNKWLHKSEKHIPHDTSKQPEQADMNTQTDHDTLKTSKLEEMKAIMGIAFDQLIPAYIEQSNDMVDNMSNMLEDSNYETLERYAHSMKSSSLNIGAETLSNLAKSLEDMCREQKEDKKLKSKIIEIEDEYVKVKDLLKQYQERG